MVITAASTTMGGGIGTFLGDDNAVIVSTISKQV